MQGRLVGSTGNNKAEKYIEDTFKNIRLDTLFENNYYQSYYQAVNSLYRGDINNSKLKMVKNVIGVIKGKDTKTAVVISAHFDHLGYIDGNLIRGALDNASGLSALIQIANTLKEKSKERPFDMDIILCAFNGEEHGGLAGSRAFINAITTTGYSLFNINIDSIGSKYAGKLALKNKSKFSDNLYIALKSIFKKDNIDFSETSVQGISDHANFESTGIPNIFIVQEGIEKLVHKPTDTPNALDYNKIKN